MSKPAKQVKKTREKAPETTEKEPSHFDRAPRQKNSDRNPVKSAEDIRDVPIQHGTLK